MQILLQDVLPEGIPTPRPNHPIWQRELKLDTSNNYLIKGSSGHGKSTLLHILSGVRRNFSGQLYFDEVNARTHTNHQWANIRQNQISVVYQDLKLLPHLTGRQNLLLKTKLQKAVEDEQIDVFASDLGIEPCLDQSCERLSYGQRQRLAIVRALLQPFHFLLLDEPFSHLDPANVEMALNLIHKVCSEKKSGILLTTLHEEHGFPYDELLEV